MLVHHVKGQPAAPTYVREKGGITSDTMRHPVHRNTSNIHGGTKLFMIYLCIDLDSLGQGP